MKLSAELPQGRYSQHTLQSLAMFDESEVPLDVINDLVQHIHAYEGEGAILIFLSGWEEISAVRQTDLREIPNGQAVPHSKEEKWEMGGGRGGGLTPLILPPHIQSKPCRTIFLIAEGQALPTVL